ncbi:IF-2B-domain-containing protein [Pleurotus eryngii]|uniref:Translation initiation factor eIF2B subunit delta n=1 Tax=Pleurotus eryngii TaxID=5323 RepID=A0A9P5ZWT6_PLEER|nr:IF-2B-domain-containing protein [Pleurotus eryngii]
MPAITNDAGPPALGPSSSTPGPANAPPSQKAMTKAERRELQERQRAAKAASKEQQLSGGSAPARSQARPGPASAPTPQRGPPPAINAPPRTPIAANGPQRGTPQRAGGSAGRRSSNAHDYQRARTSGDAASVAGGDDDPANRSRGLRIFLHFGLPKPKGHAIKGDIHPAIIRLGLQFSEFKICGANARCIATLTAFKTVIQDYVTPPNNTLSRHLMTHLSPQITHLVSARPMSVTMGNAIRQLKLEISDTDIDLPEQDAKDALCLKIDTYIRDRIIIADEVISELAGKKIKDGDVILTFARSSVVEKVLLRAHAEGKRFSVIVIDSRPMLEGKHLLKRLTSAPASSFPPTTMSCTYALLPALPSLISKVTTVILGAHSLHSNGALYSRAGTAMVAMLAKQHSVPVLVCCETYKFSEGIILDGFEKNELAPPLPQLRTSFPSTKLSSSLALEPQPNLEILNPLYDLTPPSCVTAVVTEVGLIPPTSISSIPVALGRTVL